MPKMRLSRDRSALATLTTSALLAPQDHLGVRVKTVSPVHVEPLVDLVCPETLPLWLLSPDQAAVSAPMAQLDHLVRSEKLDPQDLKDFRARQAERERMDVPDTPETLEFPEKPEKLVRLVSKGLQGVTEFVDRKDPQDLRGTPELKDQRDQKDTQEQMGSAETMAPQDPLDPLELLDQSELKDRLDLREQLVSLERTHRTVLVLLAMQVLKNRTATRILRPL